MTFARDKANQVQSAFRSVGIDDNADALAITIDSTEQTTFSGTAIMDGNSWHKNNKIAYFGDGLNLQIKSDGTNAFITESGGSGNLRIQGQTIRLEKSDGEIMLEAINDAGVDIRHNNITKLETVATGITVHDSSNAKITVRSADGTSASVKLQRINENDVQTDFELKNDGGSFKIKSDSASQNEYDLFKATPDETIIYTGNTERMRVHSTGRVAVGNTSPKAALHVTGSNGILVESENTNGDGQIYFGDTTGTDRLYLSRSLNDFAIWNVSNGIIKLATNNAERVRILSDGKVGIGTTSPGRTFTVGGDGIIGLEGSANAVAFTDSSTLRAYITSQSFGDHNGDGLGIVTATGEPIKFFTNGGERTRIQSDGKVGINTNSPGNRLVVNDNTADLVFRVNNTKTSGGIYGQLINFSYAPDDNSNHFFYCADTVANRMFIYADGDIKNHDNSYGQVSDERIKENITDANSQWDDLKALKVRNFERKDDIAEYGEGKKVQIGLIAQECEAVSPGLVKESEPMAEDIKMSSEFGTLYEDGDDIPEGKKIGDVKEIKSQVKGISYSVLYMKAVKALQEAMDRIETLETEVTALKNN